MKFFLLSLAFFIGAPFQPAFAQTSSQLSPSCQKTLESAAIQNKNSGLWLEYEVEDVSVENGFGIAHIIGSMSDADADYWYSEKFFVSYNVGTDGSCAVQQIKLIETVDDGDVTTY
jgi:hypothetical protein